MGKMTILFNHCEDRKTYYKTDSKKLPILPRKGDYIMTIGIINLEEIVNERGGVADGPFVEVVSVDFFINSNTIIVEFEILDWIYPKK